MRVRRRAESADRDALAVQHSPDGAVVVTAGRARTNRIRIKSEEVFRQDARQINEGVEKSKGRGRASSSLLGESLRIPSSVIAWADDALPPGKAGLGSALSPRADHVGIARVTFKLPRQSVGIGKVST